MNKKNQNVLILVLLASLGLNLYFLLQGNDQSKGTSVDTEITEQVSEAIKPNDADLQARHDKLLERNADLEAQLLLVTQGPFESGNKSVETYKEPRTNFSSTYTSVNSLTKEEIRQQQEERERPFKEFEVEAVDPNWAYETQDKINQALVRYSNKISFGSTVCKATMCKLTVTPHDSDEISQMTAINIVTSGVFSGEILRSQSQHFKYNGDGSIEVLATVQK